MSSSCAATAPEPFRSLRITAASAAATSPDLDLDADVDVLALSPRALLEPGRQFACDVCGRQFHRVHNMYKHRRLHGAPSRKQLDEPMNKSKVVFVCPEPRCRRHHPAHAMASFTAIRRHFQQEHGDHRTRWTCGRCSRVFAIHAKYKHHLRTCGTQPTRIVDHHQPGFEKSPSQTTDCGLALGVAASSLQLHEAAAGASVSCGDLEVGLKAATPNGVVAPFHPFDPVFTPLTPPDRPVAGHDIELQFIPPRRSCAHGAAPSSSIWLRCVPPHPPAARPNLELSLWFGNGDSHSQSQASASAAAATAARIKAEARQQWRLATAEQAAAEAARAEARRQAQLAQHELAVARRVRLQAQAEFGTAHALHYHHAARQVDAALPQATCCHKLMRSDVAGYVTSVFAEVGNGGHLN